MIHETQSEENHIVKKGFVAEGATNPDSRVQIIQQVMQVDGVRHADFNHVTKRGMVEFDSRKTYIDQILDKVDALGYTCYILDKEGTTVDSPAITYSDATQHTGNGKIQRVDFRASGTTCRSCENVIKREAKKIEGVKDIDFDYTTERGTVEFDPAKTSVDEIFSQIGKKGYSCSTGGNARKSDISTGWILGIIGIIIAAYFAFTLVEGVQVPQISQNMSYGLLFVVGLLTGFHCIAMCGGFVVGYTARDAQQGRASHQSHAMYAVGKTVSYVIIGAIFGLLGSIITFTPQLRGIAGLLAGIFLIVFGLNMLNIIPALRNLQFRTPAFIARFVGKNSAQSSSPLIIGLLNGLMIACGPLQAIYIMAAGTGSPLEGAKLLLIFGLGTLPVMLGFAYFASAISSKMTHTLLKVSGAVVIVLGLIMLNNGLVLTGSGIDVGSLFMTVPSASALPTQTPLSGGSDAVTMLNDNIAVQKNGFQEIHMTVDGNGFTPNKFVLKEGVPVKWVIDGKQLTSCNRAIQVPSYGLQFDVKPGLQTIEFTPAKEGTIRWSCWMGMIPGVFVVQKDISSPSATAAAAQNLQASAPATGMQCGSGSGGGCGCGMMG